MWVFRPTCPFLSMKRVIKAVNIAYPGEALWHSILPLMPQKEKTAAENLNHNITVLWPNPSNSIKQERHGSLQFSSEITHSFLRVKKWKLGCSQVLRNVVSASPWWYSLQLYSHTIFFFSSASELIQGTNLVLHFAYWTWVPYLIYCTHWNYPLRHEWWMSLEVSLWHSCLLCSVQKHWWNYLQSDRKYELNCQSPFLWVSSPKGLNFQKAPELHNTFSAWSSSLSQL